jgi:hypothetical protein
MQECDSEKNGQSNLVPQIRSSVQQLGTYGKPVMISHFKLWRAADCQVSAFKEFAAERSTDASPAPLTKNHLFAWNFMQDSFITDTVPRDPDHFFDVPEERRIGRSVSFSRAGVGLGPAPEPARRRRDSLARARTDGEPGGMSEGIPSQCGRNRPGNVPSRPG